MKCARVQINKRGSPAHILVAGEVDKPLPPVAEVVAHVLLTCTFQETGEHVGNVKARDSDIMDTEKPVPTSQAYYQSISKEKTLHHTLAAEGMRGQGRFLEPHANGAVLD